MRMRIVSALALAALLSAEAFAHEYWLEPETFFPAPGRKTAVRLYVGDGLVKDRQERPFQLDKTRAFLLLSSSGTLDLMASAADGATPAYSLTPGRAGGYLLALERNWSYIKLAPVEFEDYLREDGMEYVVAERARLGESAMEGRERYARFVKTLLRAGDRPDGTYKRVAGLKLEIVPLEDPYSKRAGDTLRLRVLFEGRPLAGRTVFAESREGAAQRMTTDRKGRVSVRLDRGGPWLVHLVFMRRCAAGCGEADWESFWGSLSFGVR